MSTNITTIRILYKNPSTGIVCVVYPSGESTLDYITKHAIPKDCSYWIVQDTDIPKDRSFRDAWELDLDSLGEPDGVGEAEL
jgi:hypothetical protein